MSRVERNLYICYNVRGNIIKNKKKFNYKKSKCTRGDIINVSIKFLLFSDLSVFNTNSSINTDVTIR